MVLQEMKNLFKVRLLKRKQLSFTGVFNKKEKVARLMEGGSSSTEEEDDLLDIEVATDVLQDEGIYPPHMITLVLGEGQEEMVVSRDDLVQLSPKFQELLKGTSDKSILVLDVRPRIIRKLLEFHQTRRMEVSEDFGESFHILKAAEQFQMNELIANILAQFAQLPLDQYACQLFQEFQRVGPPSLASAAKAYVEQNAHKIFASDGFLQLTEETLCNILSSDELTVPAEIDLFFAVLRWGQSLCGGSFKSTSGEDLREFLAKPLRLIRFPCMSSEDFEDYVLPTKLLDPDQLQSIQMFWQQENQGVNPDCQFSSQPRNYFGVHPHYDHHDDDVVSTEDPEKSLPDQVEELLVNYMDLGQSVLEQQVELQATKKSLDVTQTLTSFLQQETLSLRKELSDTVKELKKTQKDILETAQILSGTMHRLESTWKLLHKKTFLYERTSSEVSRITFDLNHTKTILSRTILSHDDTKRTLEKHIMQFDDLFEDLEDTKDLIKIWVNISREYGRELSELKGNNSGWKGNNSRLERNNSELKENNLELEGDNFELKENNFELKENNFELKENNSELKENNSELEGDNSELKKNNSKLKCNFEDK